MPGGDAPDEGRTDSQDNGSSPDQIESVAVTTADVVDALEAAVRSDRDIVLRVTPPFSGRMRARLHDAGAVAASDGRESPAAPPSGPDAQDDADQSPLHLLPEQFVIDPPPFPTVDDTEDELRAADASYTRARHRALQQVAVEAWRVRVRSRLTGEVTIETDNGSTTVSVAYLGACGR